jgi:hypothetical protein
MSSVSTAASALIPLGTPVEASSAARSSPASPTGRRVATKCGNTSSALAGSVGSVVCE